MMTPALNIDGRDVPAPIWGGNARLYWRSDEFGRPDQALYIGALCIGTLMKWDHPTHPGTPWRAWLMIDEDGASFGWFETKERAMGALVDAAVKELGK